MRKARRFGAPGTALDEDGVEKRIFWTVFLVLGLIADFTLPLMWSLIVTIPIAFVSWWVAYRSTWFD